MNGFRMDSFEVVVLLMRHILSVMIGKLVVDWIVGGAVVVVVSLLASLDIELRGGTRCHSESR